SCNATLSAVAGGSAGSCDITETVAASYNFTASYPGDSTYMSSSTSVGTPVTVGMDNTTTAITSVSSSSGSFAADDNITVSVSVTADSPGGGTPTNMVSVSDGVSGSCNVTLSGGVGNCVIDTEPAGTYTLTATYGGDSNYLASPPSSGFNISVGEANTTTTAITTGVASLDQPITANVTVTGTGSPTGTVTVTDGLQTCPVTLSGGTGSCQLTEAALGDYTFVATYNGDSLDSSSTSSVPVDVLNSTTTTMTSPSNGSTAVVGQPITFDVGATVNSPGTGTPTGQVAVTDGTQTCNATLTGGIGSCNIAEPAVGDYYLTATYKGDANDDSSDPTAPVEVTVGAASSATTISSTTSNPAAGQPITVDVQVAGEFTGPGVAAPSGTVTVSDGTQHCDAVLSGSDGTATGSCAVTAETAGLHSFTASFPGDGNFDSSDSSSPTAVSVGPASSATTITGITPSPLVGQPITVDVQVAGEFTGTGVAAPSGTVTVSEGTQHCDASLSGSDGTATGSCAVTAETA
ncbi:MAG: Ig-like domain repeat protein, partial [Acidimicrobiales bacterium]